jgi:hypothetical protein
MASIPSDEGTTTETTGALTVSDAQEAFLNRWKSDAPEEPSDNEEGATEANDELETEEASETEEVEETEETEESDADPEETPEPEKKKTKYVDDDDAVVKIKVGDEELSASVKDLKRLYGQEAALTKKSQEVALKRKEVEDQGARHAVGLQKLYERAVEKYKPFAEIDMLVASKTLSNDEFAALRQEASRAFEDVQFLEQELGGFMQNLEAQRQNMLREQARVAIDVLKDPEQGIPNWSQETYADIRKYAVRNGMPTEVVNNLVDPFIIKSIWKAMTYDNGKSVATVKKAKAPTKLLKSKTSSEAERFSKADGQKALQKLKSTGSRDDAAAAFLSRWGIEE